MSVDITYFVHGTTTDNEQRLSSGRNDVELSELGIQQAVGLWDMLKDMHFDVVFCSDLQRASRSAELAFAWKIPIVIDSRLRECNYGDLNGCSSDIVEPMCEQCVDTPFPNGESYEDVKVRIQGLLEDIKSNYDGKRVAIVAHKAPQLVLDVLVDGKTREEAFSQDWRKTKSRKPGRNYTLS